MAVPVVATMEENRIVCRFDFDAVVVSQLKTVPGAKFKPRDKGGPYWYFPMEVAALRDLRRTFPGDALRIDGPLREWAVQEIERAETLASLALGDQAPLELLPEVLPDLWRAVQVGPKGRGWSTEQLDAYIQENPEGSYQTADVSYLAHAENPLNGNQPGLGKTIETIASVFEAGMDDGPHLIAAPKTSLESVWEAELLQWQPYPVWTCQGDASRKRRIIQDFMQEPGPGFLIVNHHTLQGIREKKPGGARPDEVNKMKYRFPELYEIEWNTVIIDEVHKAGFRDTSSLLFRGINALHAQKKIAISGTPVGGKPVNLWIVLHWLNPEAFGSKWRWAERWLNISDNGFGKEIGTIKKDLEEEFYHAHASYFLRRRKEEVLPDLPPKQFVDLWVDMDARQARQYKEFALAAEVRIGDEKLSATSILAEYTRLKQFAISYNDIEYYTDSDGERKFRPIPTYESCKLAALEELLEERGILGDDRSGDEQVVIFSQFKVVVDMIQRWLEEKGVKTLKITGDVKSGERTRATQEFQRQGEYAGEGDHARVMLLTTTAGGVAITLDNADTVVFMDETWVPDDQEQAADRVHRASRIHQVTIYTIRTHETVEHYIHERLIDKENINQIILDLRRNGLRAVQGKK